MSLLTRSGTDAFVQLLCQMEFLATMDITKYWKLSTYMADLTFDTFQNDLAAMKHLQPAFDNPNHPSHVTATAIDGYCRSIADLLTTAGAELTTLYAHYPRYMRLAVLGRLESRFPGLSLVDRIRIAWLDSKDSESHRQKTKEAERLENAGTIQKEKERKKAQGKRRKQLRRTLARASSHDQSGPSAELKTSNVAMVSVDDGLPVFGDYQIDSRSPVLDTRLAVGSTQNRELFATPVHDVSSGPTIDLVNLSNTGNAGANVQPTRNDSVDCSVATTIPRPSLASIWTLKDQSSSASNTSPSSSEKDHPQGTGDTLDIDASVKQIKAFQKEGADCFMAVKNEEFAATSREEELNAHIIRIAQRAEDTSVASLMTFLLPKNRPVVEPPVKSFVQASVMGVASTITVQAAKSTKERRKIRVDKEEADLKQARDLDLANELLYSGMEKDSSPILVQAELQKTPEVALEIDEVTCELDTMYTTPFRGRHYNKTR